MFETLHCELSKTQRKDYLLRAFRQVGKEYDFNFDIETDKRIVCSELAYVIFHDINWPTEKSLGRYTISPDNVAVMALKNGPLKVIQLYKDGKKVRKNKTKIFAKLLKGDSALPSL